MSTSWLKKKTDFKNKQTKRKRGQGEGKIKKKGYSRLNKYPSVWK